MNTTHEVTTRTAPDGRKVGYTYRGVIINGWDGRSTQFAMRVDQYGRTRTERSKRTSIARTCAKIDYLIDGGFRTVNDEGVMV
jgi:hypothetical protein